MSHDKKMETRRILSFCFVLFTCLLSGSVLSQLVNVQIDISKPISKITMESALWLSTSCATHTRCIYTQYQFIDLTAESCEFDYHTYMYKCAVPVHWSFCCVMWGWLSHIHNTSDTRLILFICKTVLFIN